MNLTGEDYGLFSRHPAIKQAAGYLEYLLVGVRSQHLEEDIHITNTEMTTASQYADETVRVLRVKAECDGKPVTFDITVSLAAPLK
ncbi:hypothetical protein HRW12_00715 [Streptomyces lunaelactis]|uniref:hypothetical protein n=1 Tax=Streptomyces lunaelactis TaxID=1535768 RepID=UPI0015858E13|nr:hypothetical protein [Streptomyces lunaelactis]NUK32320.1 hypothetical protein [Streptomyces lunaelactis]NUK40350.1 hypothetical protein [Streptomyces lunaelactis]